MVELASDDPLKKFHWFLNSVADQLITLNQSHRFPLWCIYDHPIDFPERYVARLWLDEDPTNQMIAAKELEVLQSGFESFGFICLSRSPFGDPKILECWI